MRLTALCICGTLLTFLSLSSTTADAGEGVLLGDKGFGPCAATLRPAVPCRQGQDDSTCPYLFSLPPLTIHLPKQLRELEKIMKDLQKLKDNVDQLREICADCKVSQSESACGRQGEKEHEKLTEGKHEHNDERNWMNERNPERLQENDRDLRQECGMDRVKAAEETMEGDGDSDLEKRTTLEEKERKKWEAERESDGGVVKENENEKTLKEVAEKDGKTQAEGAKGKDKLRKAKVPAAGGNERAEVREKVVTRNNKETDRDKEKDGKGNSKGDREDNERKTTTNVKNKEKTERSDHHVWQDETKETEKKTQTEDDRGRDRIKMSEDHDRHTNREQEQRGEERKKEMEKGIKVERNNEKPKQTESIGRAKKEMTIKEGEAEEDREKGKEIKTEEEKAVQSVQRDSDGELASSKAIGRTDFVSISPTLRSIISLTQRPDSMGSDEAITITSSLPSPPLSSSTSHFITDVIEEATITAYGLPTPSTDLWAAGITEHPEAESAFRSSRPATTATKTHSAGASSQDGVSSTTATSTTTDPPLNLYTATFPGTADRSRWPAKKNISSNTKTGVKPLPARAPKPSEKHKTGVKPVADQKQKNSRYERKPDQTPLTDKKPKHDQKHKPSPQKPTADQTSKPGKDSKRVQISKPDKRPDSLPTDQNLKNDQIPKHGHNRTTDQNLENEQIPKHGQDRKTDQSQVPIQKQNSHQKPKPVQRPPSHQRPATVNPTSSDKEPEPDEIPIFNENSKPEKKPVHPFKTNKPDQEQKPDINLRSEEKTKPDQRPKSNQDFTPVQESESGRSQTISHTTKSDQKSVTELMGHFDVNPSPEPRSVQDSTPGQKLKPSDQTPLTDKKPKHDQNHKPSPQKPTADQTSKPGKDSKQVQISKPDKRPDSSPTGQNLKNDQIPKHGHNGTTDQSRVPIQKQNSDQKPKPPVQRPPSHHRPATVNPTSSDKETESDEILIFNQNSKPEKKPVHPFKTNKPDQEQKPDLMSRNEEKAKPDQRFKYNQDFTPVQESESGRSQTISHTTKPDQKSVTELMGHFDVNPSPEPRSVQDSTPGQKLKPSDQTPLTDKKPKHDQKYKPSPQKPTADQTPKPGKDSKRVQISKPDKRPDSSPTDQNLENDQIPKHDQDRTTDQSQVPIQKQNSHQKPKPPVQRPPSHQRPATVNPTSSDKEPEPDEIPIFNENSKPEKKPVHPFKTNKPDQEQKPDINLRSEEKTKPDQRPKSNQDFTPVQESESGGSQTISQTTKPDQKSVTELMGHFDENPSPEPKSVQDSTPGQKLAPDRDNTLSDQKPKSSQKIPQTNQKPKPSQLPKLNQKHPKFVTKQAKQNVKPKPNQTPQINKGLKVPRPAQIPNINPKSVSDQIPGAESNKTSKRWPPPRHRPPTRPTLQPGATPAQRPKPAVQPKPSPKTKTHVDLPQISSTTTGSIPNSHTDMPPTSRPVKQAADVSHSPGDTEFSSSATKTISLDPKTSNGLEAGPFPDLHALPEGLTISPNSRIASDLRPQTAGQPSSIPMTTRPNKIIRGILPSVIPSASPGSTKPNPASNGDSSLRAKILHGVKEKAPSKTTIPVPSPSAQPTSTVGSDFRSTTPVTSGPEAPAAESSTSSARELRVKVEQVAAFPINSLSPNGRPADRRPKEHPEDNQGGSKPPTLTPSKVTTARRDCSDLLRLGETKSGVYLVSPDLHSSGGGSSVPVFCDMERHGGGWTVLQRRQDGSVSFNRTWAEYRAGFGELDGGEFWLGNDVIHLLTRDRDMTLLVELEDFEGVMEYAQYDQFRVASERLRYRLTVRGYSGTAGDALRYSRSYDHNNKAFTTPDRDHDRYPSGNCGAYYSSGWWFDACMAANLNGRYYVGRYKGIRDGIFWGTWHNISTEYYPTNVRQSFKAVRMMIRPKGFTP